MSLMSVITDEGSFHPAFLRSLSDMDLVALQHELRSSPEHRGHLDQVLRELGVRDKANTRALPGSGNAER
jgi:hypothetical protein